MIDLVEVSQEGTHEIIEVSSARGRSATIAIGTITTGAAGYKRKRNQRWDFR